jgi:hypothetical protein
MFQLRRALVRRSLFIEWPFDFTEKGKVWTGFTEFPQKNGTQGRKFVVFVLHPYEPRFQLDAVGGDGQDYSQLVVTTALIPTFSPAEKGQRLDASLDAVVRRANPVTGAFWFRGSMRELVGGNLIP